MRTLTIRAWAEQDLEDCFVYLAEQDFDTGLRFLVAAEASFERLRDMPYLGVERRFANPALFGLRMWHIEGFEKYLVFYLVMEDAVDIVRLLYTSRDIAQALIED